MHAISDNAVSQQSLAAPSIASYLAGETVLSAASTIGRLLMLKGGWSQSLRKALGSPGRRSQSPCSVSSQHGLINRTRRTSSFMLSIQPLR